MKVTTFLTIISLQLKLVKTPHLHLHPKHLLDLDRFILKVKLITTYYQTIMIGII